MLRTVIFDAFARRPAPYAATTHAVQGYIAWVAASGACQVTDFRRDATDRANNCEELQIYGMLI